MSDSKSFIKITDIVNNQLRIYLTKTSLYKENYNINNDEDFAQTVELYKCDVEVLLKILILLTYYGGELYSNLILKIMSRTIPKDKNINLLYYPLHHQYYN